MANATCVFQNLHVSRSIYCHKFVCRFQKYAWIQSFMKNGQFCGQGSVSIAMANLSPFITVRKTDKRFYHSCSIARYNGSGNKLYLERHNPLHGLRCVRQMSNDPYYTSAIVVGMQDMLLTVNSLSGLPWWATIISTTVFLRLLITLPLARQQAVTVARMELIQPTINEIIESLRHNIAIKGKRLGKPLEEVNREFRMAARLHIKDIYKKEKCNPLRLYVLPWVQLPLWIVISLALRNLSGFFPKGESYDVTSLCHPDLLSGGLGWITDLSSSDPYYILPLIIGITNFVNIELNSLRKKEPSKWQSFITRLFRTLTIAMVLFASQVPSAMSLYWATSSSFGLVQNVLLMQPKVRRMLQIPKSPSESKTPIKDKLEVLKARIDLFMKIQRR